MSETSGNEDQYSYRALDINVIGFTALSFVSNIVAEVTNNSFIEGIHTSTANFAGILALSSLAAHILERKL